MKKRKILIILILIILLVLMITLIILKSHIRTPKENLEYINSDEMDSGTFSPQMIHIVIAYYEGDLNPKAISKSTYYFVNNMIPKLLKECSDDSKIDKYFEKNMDEIKFNIGINDKDEFKALMQEIKKLSGKLEFESSRFDRDNITRENSSLKTILYVKYKNNPELSFDVTISNKVYNNKSSIKFSK